MSEVIEEVLLLKCCICEKQRSRVQMSEVNDEVLLLLKCCICKKNCKIQMSMGEMSEVIEVIFLL